MQPAPRGGVPGVSAPSRSGRIRPQKQATSATATRPPPAQPITDPFAFGRAQPPMAAGGHPTIPNSNPPQMQTQPNVMYSQLGSGLPPQPQMLENVGAAGAGPPPPSLPGVTLFTPQSAASPGGFPSPSPTGYSSANSEQDYFNSRDPTSSMPTDASHTVPAPSNTLFNQDFQAQHLGHSLPFQPLPLTSSSSQWVPDHSSRPPSVQNYFQPTTDPPARPSNIPPQTQMYPTHSQSPHHNAPTPLAHPANPQSQAPPIPLQNPGPAASSLLPDPNGPPQHNLNFQTQSYFSQSSAPHDIWFNQPAQDSGYHQMGTGSSHPPPPTDFSGSPHVSNTGYRPASQPVPSSAPSSDAYAQDSGTISMFFKGSDVENEETLADERNKALNGVATSFQPNSNPPAQSSHPDLSVDYQGVSVLDHSCLPYMNESSHPSQGHNQKPPESDFDHVENLECVPNQEVLPNESSSSATAAPNTVEQFETGPNLETPDSIPRPMRSASVSSNYSNLSHGSGTGPRRHQGVEGTFIQQESPRLVDNPSAPPAAAAAGGYFEQIDTSPGGEVGIHQGSVEHMWHPTPSPPKPTGIFQASANSSFEPVRSHGVGVRPVEVDRAKMVAEGGADCTSGNLEQPPDNMENIFGSGQAAASAPADGLPNQTHPVVHSYSRPSSRAFGATRPCESPATTLWAQNDPASLGANILLAPAAPTVLAPLREPSADVIQPPEDSPLDLQPSQRVHTASQQHSENLENPPKVSDAEPADSQSSLGYASLLVSGSPHQPVLIAPPVSNYSVIPPSIPTQSSAQPNHGDVTPAERSLTQGLGANASQSSAPPKQNPLLPSGSGPFCSSAPSQAPLNLTRNKSAGATSEIPTPPLSQQVHPPLSRGQSLGAESHCSVNSQPTSLATTSVSNHNSTLNYELLDFSMHQSYAQSHAYGQPSSLHEASQSSNGFYLQVTKDAQQGVRDVGNASVQTTVPSSSSQASTAPTQAAANTQQMQNEPPKTSDSQVAMQGQRDAPPVPVSGTQPSHGQYSTLVQDPAAGNTPAPPPAASAAYPPVPQGPLPPGVSQPAPAEAPRPPSSAGSHQGYVHPPPPVAGQAYSGYYGNYGEYPDSRGQYPPGHYPPPAGDPRVQPYYQDTTYRGRADPWYGRYDPQNPGYRDPNYQYREPQSDRPSSRASQYSDRPSSRQGYPEDYQRANRSTYSEYYADYPKHYDYRGYRYGQYDQRYAGYYDQSYWSYYNESYKNGYYNQQYPARKDGYDDQWQYYPGYDPSFDEDNMRGREAYGDDFDRRSVHSEQSAHSVHSSTSHHSRRSSFSSRSQQSQVYRSQPDLSTVYDATQSTLPVDYSHAHYPNQADASQNYSQYMYPSEYTADSTWIAPEQPPPRPATPEKYTMPHRCARFGPGGHLIQVLPNLPSAGQPALVEIHNMETMLQDTSDQAELRGFPGPLIKEETHKVDVIKFSQNKAMECSRDNNLLDRDSARLLWDFIMLLCRQNGTVVGTDIADLLLKEHRSVWLPGKSPNEANLIDFNNEPLARAEEEPGAGPLSLLSDTFMIVPENIGKETERFRELLLFGRKKDALEAAMKGGLWGHALLLASKMDNRTHARVMTRFANSLPMNDPLQTMYQLMSGRMPASATCCGEERWGDWRPHLAMVLSNLTHNMDLDTRTITTMGDTLASKGLTDAAHFCYLMAQVGLGVYTKKSTKLVLIGSNHSLPFNQFATNEAIQRTEAYEYAQSLGSQHCSLPNFQVFKLIYACRLAEAGLCAQAFHYCEVISKTVLMHPSYYSPVFISQIIQMSEKLRFFDPQLKERPEQELFIEPEWLIHLKQLDGQIKTGVITYNVDRSTPAQFDCSSESSDLDHQSPPEPYNMPLEVDGQAPENPLMSSLVPGPPPQGVQLMPPAPASILQDGMAPPQLSSSSDVPQFYPVPPNGPPGQIPMPGFHPQDPGLAHPPFQPQHEQPNAYPGAHQQHGPPPQEGQMSPHMPTSQVPHSPVQMTHPPFQMPQHMPPSPGHMAPMEQPPLSHPEMHPSHIMSSSPPRSSFTPQMDLYDHMANMGSRRSRTTSQSSMHLPSGRSSRRASESSTHSGRERSNSAVKQASPPPPSIPEQPRKEEPKKAKKDSPEKNKGWSFWPFGKRKNEAHLPDDKNPSIVWDEKKNRWVDLNEPEEESKPPPPPPTGFPKMPQMPGPGGPPAPPGTGSAVNMFSRKAGTKSRYVDVLNPSRTSKPSGAAPAPVDLFAPLAPMPMPANLFVPSSAPNDQQPLEGSEGGNQEQNSPSSSAAPQVFNPTLLPPAPEGPPVPDGLQSGESHPAQGTAPTGGVTFYNPAQFAQTSAPSGGGPRSSRLSQRYPVSK
ncbi:PREDICTED: protein transport protein Sec16A isoform X2 [Cyprinodon variegatus]|uniref:protein transport protein Sec16A isoform X2 n=1 Tax=Cyprinodon variegatus TaxID=28743 RepID=UPI000742CA6E|nr:PREDICTED: protein transport protein Sec16A isoform X2 [Cyprinodon variegatus]